MSERFTLRDSDERRRVERISEEETHEIVRHALDEALKELRIIEAREEKRKRIEEESSSERLGYLVGALRDGSVYYDEASRNYYTVFYQSSREWLEDSIKPRLDMEFGRHCAVDEYKPDHFRLRVSSKEVYDVWKREFEFPEEGVGQASWDVPSEIKSADERVKACFIRGVFDTEGDVSPESSKTPYVGISQKNETFLSDIRDMLLEMDIQPGKIHVIDQESGTLRVAVSERDSLERFITIIGSEHPTKADKLQRIQGLLGQRT